MYIIDNKARDNILFFFLIYCEINSSDISTNSNISEATCLYIIQIFDLCKKYS